MKKRRRAPWQRQLALFAVALVILTVLLFITRTITQRMGQVVVDSAKPSNQEQRK